MLRKKIYINAGSNKLIASPSSSGSVDAPKVFMGDTLLWAVQIFEPSGSGAASLLPFVDGNDYSLRVRIGTLDAQYAIQENWPWNIDGEFQYMYTGAIALTGATLETAMGDQAFIEATLEIELQGPSPDVFYTTLVQTPITIYNDTIKH